MTRLIWNAPGERFFETGVDRGVLYPRVGPGVPWNGLISVGESSSGGDVEPLYFEGVKVLDFMSSEDFVATLEAYSAPPEFAACEGARSLVPGLYATQQPRTTFGFSYRTLLGNDTEGLELGYKLHVVYNCTAEPEGRQHKTLGDSVSVSTRQWTIQTVPQQATTYKPTAHFMFDSTELTAAKLAAIEAELYGTVVKTPRLPDQSEILTILAGA